MSFGVRGGHAPPGYLFRVKQGNQASLLNVRLRVAHLYSSLQSEEVPRHSWYSHTIPRSSMTQSHLLHHNSAKLLDPKSLAIYQTMSSLRV